MLYVRINDNGSLKNQFLYYFTWKYIYIYILAIYSYSYVYEYLPLRLLRFSYSFLFFFSDTAGQTIELPPSSNNFLGGDLYYTMLTHPNTVWYILYKCEKWGIVPRVICAVGTPWWYYARTTLKHTFLRLWYELTIPNSAVLLVFR